MKVFCHSFNSAWAGWNHKTTRNNTKMAILFVSFRVVSWFQLFFLDTPLRAIELSYKREAVVNNARQPPRPLRCRQNYAQMTSTARKRALGIANTIPMTTRGAESGISG